MLRDTIPKTGAKTGGQPVSLQPICDPMKVEFGIDSLNSLQETPSLRNARFANARDCDERIQPPEN